MLTVRPLALTDADAFSALHGACDAESVRALVARSDQAFAGVSGTSMRYVFSLVNTDADTGQSVLLGAIALVPRIGLELARYSFRSGVVVHASAELNMFNRANTLLLANDHTGCAEIGLPLVVQSEWASLHQRNLIESALLYVAEQRACFPQGILVELPGVCGDSADPPFWTGLGRHFYAGAVPMADAFFPPPQRSHIARLLPKHPLYSGFIGAPALACLGQAGAAALGAADTLQAQGFRYRGHVNIFDAGPIVEADIDDVLSPRYGHVLPVCLDGGDHPQPLLVAAMGAHRGQAFSVGCLHASLLNGALCMSPAVARAFGLVQGQVVRVLPPR